MSVWCLQWTLFLHSVKVILNKNPLTHPRKTRSVKTQCGGEVLNALISAVQDCAKKETNAKKLRPGVVGISVHGP